MLPVWLALATSVSSPGCDRELAQLFTIEQEAGRRHLDEAQSLALAAFNETAVRCPDDVQRAWHTPPPPNWDGLSDWEWLATVGLGHLALPLLRPADDLDDAWAWLALGQTTCPNPKRCAEVRALRAEDWATLASSDDPFLKAVAALGRGDVAQARAHAARVDLVRRFDQPPLYLSSIELVGALRDPEDDLRWKKPFEKLLRYTRRRYAR